VQSVANQYSSAEGGQKICGLNIENDPYFYGFNSFNQGETE